MLPSPKRARNAVVIGFTTWPLVVIGRNVSDHVGLGRVGDFLSLYATTAVDRLVDPHWAWMFWLGVGSAIGTWIGSHLRRIEEQDGVMRDDMAGLRRLATRVRRSIERPWLRRLSGDLSVDLGRLGDMLASYHGFPPLPGLNHDDPETLARTSEYLRRVLPNLRSEHLAEARHSAERYVQQMAELDAERRMGQPDA